jgi:hypothetical protein
LEFSDFGPPGYTNEGETTTMKKIITVCGLILLLSTATLSQNAPDSSGRQERQRQRTGFVDENADGIKDRRQHRQERMKRRTDRFIDANGDGISDSRECGLGFRRGATSATNGTGKQSGKKGQGGK